MSEREKPRRHSGAMKQHTNAPSSPAMSQGEFSVDAKAVKRLSMVPRELRVRPQWVGFRVRDGKKTPVVADDPTTKAKCNDPSTWRPFDVAEKGLKRGDFNAVAYALHEDYIAVDLDACIENGHLSAFAHESVKGCGSYTEKSVSGTGVHIILRGKLPGDRGRKGNGVEVYGKARFLICTGDVVLKTPKKIVENPDAVAWILENAGTVPRVTERAETTEAICSVVSGVSGLSVVSVTPEDVIQRTLPQGSGERNARLLDLARGLKFNCGLADAPLSELKPTVCEWHRRALEAIRTKDFDTTWADFVHAWPRVRFPLGEDILQQAWERACRNSQGDEVKLYDSERVRHLVALCRELAALSQHGGFFLGARPAGKLVGVQPMQALRFLRMLEADGVIKIVKRGDAHRATRYRWLGIRRVASPPEPAVAGQPLGPASPDPSQPTRKTDGQTLQGRKPAG